MNEAQFRKAVQEHGYGEPGTFEYGPNTASEMHTHDVTNFVFVTEGALTFVTEDGETTCGPGETYTMPAGTLHCERTGAEGMKALVGKK